MIQITYNEMGDMMFLRAEGHAEFAPKGQDIVCAAVSALMQTLAYSLDSGTVTCADDRNLMVVQAKQGTDSLAKFELVTDGLILLADAYPEHVRYINLHADKADAIDLQLFADGGTGANGDGTSQSAGADSSPNGRANASAGAANGEGNAIELPALRPAEERLARRSGVLKRSSREEGSPSQSAQSAASSPEGGALGSEEKSELDEEAAENQNEVEGKDGEEKGEGKTKSPEERRKAFGELLRGEYADLTEELMQNAVTEATRRLEASPAMKSLMQALQEKYGTDANDLVALTEAVRSGVVKDDAYYETLLMNQAGLTQGSRPVEQAAHAVSEKTGGAPAAAIELPDGTVVTGKTGPLLGAASSALLNALKKLAGIDQELDLVSAAAIEPIQTLKTNYLGSKNPRLHTDEILIALSSSAAQNPTAAAALKQLSHLKGCDMHSTVILSSVDMDTVKKLGMYLTCEPAYEEADRMYHKK